jgi:hypothetical protein
MLPNVLDISMRSLRSGTYVREGKYLKYDAAFQALMNDRDPKRGLTVTQDESHTIYSSVLATLPLSGSIAEVGVYQGTTARLIAELKGEKKLFLFDTFEGMPNKKISTKDDWELNTHTDTSLSHVQKYLSAYSNIFFIQGQFPESIVNSSDTSPIHNEKFCFVNLDVDLYQSTLDGLEFFFPRLVDGGRLVSHNYNLKDSPGGRTPGVKKAFLEYFSGQEHKIIEIAETQCMVLK